MKADSSDPSSRHQGELLKLMGPLRTAATRLYPVLGDVNYSITYQPLGQARSKGGL